MGNTLESQFDINLVSIKKDAEYFDYQIDREFFENFDQDIVSEGQLDVNLHLTKTDLMITIEFDIRGTVKLVCDKSLKPFDEVIQVDQTIYFKFGEGDEELDVNLFQIDKNTLTLPMASHIMEFILLEIPYRKIHPSLRDADEESDEDELLYQTEIDQEIEEKPDPRWEGLNKLKDKFKK